MKRGWGALAACMLMMTPSSVRAQSIDEIFSITSSTVVASVGGVILSSYLTTDQRNKLPTNTRPKKRRRKEKQRRRRRRFLRMMRIEPQAIEHAVRMGQGGAVEDLAALFEVERRHERAFARMLRARRGALTPYLASPDAASAAAFLEVIERGMYADAALRPGYLLRIAILGDDATTGQAGTP